jgi:hypothetical protein
VSLENSDLSATAAPALARLLAGGAVTELLLCGHGERLWDDEAGAALLSNALRASTSLRHLRLLRIDAWNIPAAATALLGALTGHASLRQLDLRHNHADDAQQTAAAAAALGALVAADTLTELDVSHSFGDAALGPLFDALPAVTRLRLLDCECDRNDDAHLSDAFIRGRVMPALRANASLRVLKLGDRDDALSRRLFVRVAEALVISRAD